nr:immunoglobulin light chain junction region [Macaca mulatta]MOX29488.1 immunoglobulin light chain junction region [Macaca mulatta]MOX29581.1 immunoglobulin light chain junction region [Macaca mulatta]MOX30146.1 immunoglobulin light chain junction region [Macaca mulatta]MOX30500.1 immunoglobulin light chain junction region [Macaca mulatta]
DYYCCTYAGSGTFIF